MNERVGEVLKRVRKGIEPHLGRTDLVSDGILDSLDIMRLIVELEGEFGIEIPPEDVLSDNFESVNAIIALIDKCRAQA